MPPPPPPKRDPNAEARARVAPPLPTILELSNDDDSDIDTLAKAAMRRESWRSWEELYDRFPTEKEMKAASHLGATEFSSEQVLSYQKKKIDVQCFEDDTKVMGGAAKRKFLQENATVMGDAGNGCYGAVWRALFRNLLHCPTRTHPKGALARRIIERLERINGEKQADIIEALLTHLRQMEKENQVHHRCLQVFNALVTLMHAKPESKYYKMKKLWEPPDHSEPLEKSAAAESTTSTQKTIMADAQPLTPEWDDDMQSNDKEKRREEEMTAWTLMQHRLLPKGADPPPIPMIAWTAMIIRTSTPQQLKTTILQCLHRSVSLRQEIFASNRAKVESLTERWIAKTFADVQTSASSRRGHEHDIENVHLCAGDHLKGRRRQHEREGRSRSPAAERRHDFNNARARRSLETATRR